MTPDEELELQAEAEALAELEMSQQSAMTPPPQQDQGSAWDAIPSFMDVLKSPINLAKGIGEIPFMMADAAEGTAELITGRDINTGQPKDRLDTLRNGLRTGRDLAASATMIPGAVTAARSLSEDDYSPEQARQDMRGELASAPLNFGLTAAAPKIASKVEDAGVNEIVGYNPELKQGKPLPVDANGNVVTPNLAIAQASKKDLKIKDLVDGGYPDMLNGFTDGHATASLKLQQFKASAGKQIGDIVDGLVPLEQQYVSQLAPWEAQAYFKSASPSFESAMDYLDGIKSTNPAEAAVLETKFNAIKSAWDASDQSLITFKQMQENLGLSRQASFAPGSAKESFGRTLDNLMYSDIAKSLEGRIGHLGSVAGDANLGTTFSKANKSYSAAATFENDAFYASRKSLKSKIGNDPWRAIGRGAVSLGTDTASMLAPVQYMKGAEALNQLTNFAGRVPITNPLILTGNETIPRNWTEVKENPRNIGLIAMKAGVPTDLFNSLPESAQKDIHKMVVLQNPQQAAFIPGNYSVVNDEFTNPFEKEAVVRDAMKITDASERARIIGGAFENKYVYPTTPQPVQMNPAIQQSPDIDMVMNSLNGAFEANNSFGDATSMTNEMKLNQLIHAQDG